jgi:solute carrier family 26 protein
MEKKNLKKKKKTDFHLFSLPGPKVPPLFIIKDMLINTFLTALIAFTINYSLADLFSKKQRYKINPTQELFAAGASNVFASFFPCFASGASLARSCVQFNSGGKTQVSEHCCIKYE